MSVVLDTSALMMPVECDLRLFDELERVLGGVEAVVPDACVVELEGLADGAGEAARAARVGLDLLDRCTVRETDATGGDAAVLELATQADADYAVTNDATLRNRLLDAGVSVVSLRSKNKLAITQP